MQQCPHFVMSKGKSSITTHFVSLMIWWLVLFTLDLTHGLGNSFFNLGMGIYAFIFSIVIAVSAYIYEKELPHKFGVIISSFGMSMFGMGTILWFYYDYIYGVNVPFPSLSDMFYVLQFPFSLIGLIALGHDFNGESKNRVGESLYEEISSIAVKSLGIILLVFGAVSAFEVQSYGTLLNAENFLLLYFPTESFVIFVIAFVTYVVSLKSWEKTSSNWFLLYLLGSGLWFVGDLIFHIQYLEGSYFNGSTSDLMYLAGSFLMMLGLTGVLEGSKREGFLSPFEPVFYEKYTTYRISSLNVKKVLQNFSFKVLTKEPKC